MKVKLENVRLFFPELFAPVPFDEKTPPEQYRYGAVFGLPKSGEMHKRVSAAIREAAVEGWKSKADAMIESIKGNANKFCLTDGDVKTYEGTEGLMTLSARRKRRDGRPWLCDSTAGSDGKPIQITEDNGRLYSGCYVNASVDIWAQVKDYPGIRCTLLGVQFYKDGDAFSGAAKSSPDDFAPIEDGTKADSLV